MGGEVLLHLLIPLMGPVRAGWLAAGLVLAARLLNPVGWQGIGLALCFVYSQPWLYGFLNFTLASGLALLVFALWLGRAGHHWQQAALLLLAQPVLLLCHAMRWVGWCWPRRWRAMCWAPASRMCGPAGPGPRRRRARWAKAGRCWARGRCWGC